MVHFRTNAPIASQITAYEKPESPRPHRGLYISQVIVLHSLLMVLYDCEYCGFLQCELLQASELNADEYFFPQHLATVAPFILSFRKSSFPFHVHVNFALVHLRVFHLQK